MTESEVEQVVLDVVRRYTQNESAAVESRFAQDLHLSDVARQMLFASVAQAFVARGVSLPSQRFYLSDFLACPTPAAVRDAIRVKAFGAKAPAATEAPSEAPVKPAAEEAKSPPPKAKPAGKPASAKKKAVKKSAPRAKPRRGKR